MTAAVADHWHLIGQQWRPLHEQLAVLEDTATWASVSAESSRSAPHGIGPVVVGPSFGLVSVQHGGNYGLLAITGEVSRPDISHIRVQLQGMLTVGLRHLVIDLSGVREADPRLGVLLDRTNRRLRAMEGSITIVNVPQAVISILVDSSLRSRVARCAQTEADPERDEGMICAAERAVRVTAAARGRDALPSSPPRPQRRPS
jgi:ABC-type transporter Mla MlaB component